MTGPNNKKFTSARLSHSGAHHLMAVGQLLDQRGYARVSDIARALDVTRGSASVVMRSLREAGYVAQDENHFYTLTDLGRRTVSSIAARHRVVERFLVEVLGLSPEQSHEESCHAENLIAAPTARRLAMLVDFWNSRGLAEPFQAADDLSCPVCGGDGADQCPCCGLECLDGDCSRTADRR